MIFSTTKNMMALNAHIRKSLERRFPGRIRFDALMAEYTSFKVGGPADVFVDVENADELAGLFGFAGENGLNYLVIGDGTNLLIKDAGFRGIVVRLKGRFNHIRKNGFKYDGVLVKAMAGAKMRSLSSFAIKQGLAGMNSTIGIPGTVGGGIKMNAGTNIGAIGDTLDSVDIMTRDGETLTIIKEQLLLDYRKLSFNNDAFREGGYLNCPVILDGCFVLQPVDPVILRKEAAGIMNRRIRRQPTRLPSAGCFFKNPNPEHPAGKLIDLAGLKGRRIGGAEISTKHANFIVNTGKATAADILALVDIVKETVDRHFNIELTPEVEIVGA